MGPLGGVYKDQPLIISRGLFGLFLAPNNGGNNHNIFPKLWATGLLLVSTTPLPWIGSDENVVMHQGVETP